MNQKGIDIEDLNSIPIPEGFEERLSKKIDEWERNSERLETRRNTPRFNPVRKWLVAAVMVAAVGGLSFWLINMDKSSTESNQMIAQHVSEKDLMIANDALILVSKSMNQGLEELGKVEEGVDIMNESLEILNMQ